MVPAMWIECMGLGLGETIMLSLLLSVLIAQVPPPVPQPPAPYVSTPPAAAFSPGDQPPDTSEGKREWLLAHLIVDMELQGRYDPAKFKEYEQKIQRMTPSQLGILVNYYQLRKQEVAQHEAFMRQAAQAQVLNNAQLNLERAKAYRNVLAQELERRMQVKQQELEITRQSAAIATMQMWNSVNGRYGYGYGYGGYRAPVVPFRPYQPFRPYRVTPRGLVPY